MPLETSCPPLKSSMLLKRCRVPCSHLRYFCGRLASDFPSLPPDKQQFLTQVRKLTYCNVSRQSRLQQLVPWALQPGHTDHEPSVNAALQQLQAALHWESHHQYVDTKGQQHTFSSFAATNLSQLESQLLMPLQRSACSKLLKGFHMYQRLTQYQRAELVQSASQCLSVWMSKPLFAANQDQHRHDGAQDAAQVNSHSDLNQLPRQQSGLSASTSEAQHRDALSPADNSAWSRNRLETTAASRSPADHTRQHSIDAASGSAASANMQAVDIGRKAMPLAAGTTTSSNLEHQEPSASFLPGKAAGQSPVVDSLKVMGEEPSVDAAHTLPIAPAASQASSTDPQLTSKAQSKSSYTAHIEHTELNSALRHFQDLNLQEESSSSAAAVDVSGTTDCIQSVDELPVGAADQPEGKAQKALKAETFAFQAAFAQSAAADTTASNTGTNAVAIGQRTEEWFAMRQGRLTASSFANALGMFFGGRETLWKEKLGLVPKFAGNAATQWGTRQESEALLRYKEITGQLIEECGFQMLRDDLVHGWLGASPDGLVQPLGLQGTDMPPVLGVGAGVIHGDGPGVLEVKCPFNRGNPSTASPPKLPQWYYMPQVQGLMDVFDRDWCNLFVWTVNGSMLFHIKRDPEYWRLCFQGLAEFWWSHVVPAKHALAGDSPEIANLYMPQSQHPMTTQLIEMSKQMARDAPGTSFPPSYGRVKLAPRKKTPMPM